MDRSSTEPERNLVAPGGYCGVVQQEVLNCVFVIPSLCVQGVLSFDLFLYDGCCRRSFDDDSKRVHSDGSGTAKFTMRLRYMAHSLGFGPDHLAHIFLPTYYETEWPACLVDPPFALAEGEYAVTGYFRHALRDIMGYLQARTCYLDDLVLSMKPRQLVLLGAGYDTRSYRLANCINGTSRCFEVDSASTQASKLLGLDAAGVNHDHVVFVAADFNAPPGHDDWLGQLLLKGFDVEAETLFIWEGVTYYLSDTDIDTTLQRIVATCSRATVAMDTFSYEYIGRWGSYMRRSFGEEFRSGVHRGHEDQLILRNGLVLAAPLMREAAMNQKYIPRRESGAFVCPVFEQSGFCFITARTP